MHGKKWSFFTYFYNKSWRVYLSVARLGKAVGLLMPGFEKSA